MATNNSFNIVGLDFEEAKSSLKSYLKSQDTLKDYNFDGSVLNTILDVLAYNTHYQSFYANMVANEMFLDSAVLRPSVVSHAKTIGYVPSSRRSSKAVLNIIPNIPQSDITLTKGVEFIGTDSAGTQYRFVLLDTIYTNSEGIFENVVINEGTLRRMSYVYGGTNKANSILTIPNNKIDTSTIRVRVQKSATDTTGMTDVWSESGSYIDLTTDSKVYFLQERETGMYELYFGDNFLGKKPDVGSIVVVEYLETAADAGNGITKFTTSVGGIANIVLVSQSSGGMLEDSVTRIKFLAPKFYQSGGRAVTVDDYRASVLREYPNTDSVLVYGGETATPPQYGKVFIAVKPKSGDALTSTEKDTLVKALRSKSSVVSIIPEIIDPDFIDVIVDIVLTYDPSSLSIEAGTLKGLIVAYLFAYSSTALESFGDNFYLSKLSEDINKINSSIVSNQTAISLRKSIDLSRLFASKGFVVDYKNPIKEIFGGGGVNSSFIVHATTNGGVVSDARIVDDGNGKLNVVRLDTVNNVVVLVYPSVGTVNYKTGYVSFNNKFVPIVSNSAYQFLSITVTPANTDVFVFENKILRVSRVHPDSVSVKMVAYEKRKETLTL